jgi:hypothetical protein
VNVREERLGSVYPPGTMAGLPARFVRPLFAAFLVFFAVIPRVRAEPTLQIDRLSVNRGLVVATCRLVDAFDLRTRGSIERGLPITVRYTVDLWRDRRNWMDKQVDSRVRSYRIRYHPGERTFSVSEAERPERPLTFPTLAEALEEVSNRVLPIHPRWEMSEAHRYFVTVEAAIQPLTWNEFQELDGWLSGRIHGDHPQGEGPEEKEDQGISRAFFEFLVDLSGFGDTYYRARTPSFRPTDLQSSTP